MNPAQAAHIIRRQGLASQAAPRLGEVALRAMPRCHIRSGRDQRDRLKRRIFGVHNRKSTVLALLSNSVTQSQDC
jgi:hypothetical protein